MGANQNTNYEYDLPLTRQQQIKYDEKQQLAKKQSIKIKQSPPKTNKEENQDISMDVDEEDEDEEEENEDSDLQQQKESDKISKIETPKATSSSNKVSENISNATAISSTTSTIIVTPITQQSSKQPMNAILTSPKTPALDEKYRFLCKTYRSQNKKENPKQQNEP